MFARRKDVFFETLQNMADTIHTSMECFSNGVKTLDNLDIAAFSKKMKEFESQCDVYTHTIIKELNKTFITPIEREDIMALATELDDVIDGLEACASRFHMYNIQNIDDNIIRFTDILIRCSIELQKAIQLLSEKKLLAIHKHTIRINSLENEGDDLLRHAVIALFQQVTDPIELIKKKEIYERLEQTTDSCERIAHILESIIMRNS